MPQDKEVTAPTWLRDVRYFFDPEDIECMATLGIDLATYNGVATEAGEIARVTNPTNPSMPNDPARHWSKARHATFENWRESGMPFGTPEPMPPLPSPTAKRVRRDIRTVAADPAQLAKLEKAFSGIRNRPVDDPNSYFRLAGLHWFPDATAKTRCHHRVDTYNPWHRAYLQRFEDALRSIPGCEDVTLPYWDITGDVPQIFYKHPFDKYVLPKNIGPNLDKGYVTKRYDATEIHRRVNTLYAIPKSIDVALGKPSWDMPDSASAGFNGYIWGAHDDGHGAVGDTLQNQGVAAFDPIFWFFHANWDRLWWLWQQRLSATSLLGFKTVLRRSPAWLEGVDNWSFDIAVSDTIELVDKLDVDYEHPPVAPVLEVLPLAFGSSFAHGGLKRHPTREVSVRVKGLNRLKIPGTFTVHLRVDGKTIARHAVFQPMRPQQCGTCRKTGIINLDFLVPEPELNGRIGIAIELLGEDRKIRWFPVSRAGNPTLNARLLLSE